MIQKVKDLERNTKLRLEDGLMNSEPPVYER